MSLCLKWGFPKHPVPIHSCHSRHSQTALSTWPAFAFEGAYQSRGGPSMQTNKETDQRAQETSNDQWKWHKKNKQLIKEADDHQGTKVEQTGNQTDTQVRKWPANRGDKPAAASSCLEHSPQTFSAQYEAQLLREATFLIWKGLESVESFHWKPLGDNLMDIVGWTTRLCGAAIDERADGLELLFLNPVS